MMKLLLVALNAKYIHSNLAVYSLMSFTKKYEKQISLAELTINLSEEDILKQIYKEKADVVAFSCYIWNISIVRNVSMELRKIQPDAKIWYGGPEVSYDAKQCLLVNQPLDGIMIGEGEQTFSELMQYYVEGNTELEEIAGLAFKKSAKIERGHEQPDLIDLNEITITNDRQPICMDTIPFPYENMELFRNRIIYYESSRGCPFSCSYCLSSIDKRVRFRSTPLVMRELKILLDYQVPQVKFVDRTFNCNHKHTMDIWKFIKENDNGITNFHFEISADLLEEEEMEFLSTLRPGQVQLEIGVQTTNEVTVEAIRRKMDFEKLAHNVTRMRQARNIHQHLDLIAGLPFEGYQSFEKSFDDVYRLQPDQLQLGFLKILKGSPMETERKLYGITNRSTPPYEVLFTDSLSYEEALTIKGVCDMVETYYNSGQFTYSIRYLEHFYDSSMHLYRSISDYYENSGNSLLSPSRIKKYEILLEFFRTKVLELITAGDKAEMTELFKELLVLDLFLREDLKSRPGFSSANPKQSNFRELYKEYQTNRQRIHIEKFLFDVINSVITGKVIKKDTIILFDYDNRDPLSKTAKIMILGN